MSIETLNQKYQALLKSLECISPEDRYTEKFNKFWAEMIAEFEWLSEDEKIEILTKVKEKFNLITPDYNDQTT